MRADRGNVDDSGQRTEDMSVTADMSMTADRGHVDDSGQRTCR